ncbi:MAG: DUF4920 domain-containing protein [Saprospiraceae bacterium]|jgi:hypothetical protein|nr:DUF4920 domain-containing protein [Candidatus Brachybacter algidus]MBK8748407.1 DUF4920 domain-containing protein [Candidatus Brachybacter algidus]
MIRSIIFSLLCLFAISTFAQPPAGNAKVGDYYGEKPKTKGAMDIALLPAQLEKEPVIQTKVKAKVLDVCSAKGCWIELAVDDNTTAFVKMKDYAFFVPVAAIGKNVVLEGEAKLTTTSVEELKHYAEDAKKSQAEIDAITEPKTEIRFMASGMVVVD